MGHRPYGILKGMGGNPVKLDNETYPNHQKDAALLVVRGDFI